MRAEALDTQPARLKTGRRLLHATVGLARTQPIGAVSALIVVLLAVAALFAPWVAPENPLTGHVFIKKPQETIKLIEVPADTTGAKVGDTVFLDKAGTRLEVVAQNGAYLGRVAPDDANRLLEPDARRYGYEGLVETIGPSGLTVQVVNQVKSNFLGPLSSGFILGTDHLGRDMLSRLIYGARVSLGVSVVAVVAGSLLGASIGLVGGYYGGWIDAVLLRLVDIVMAVPVLVMALAIVTVLGPSIRNVVIAIAIIQIPQMARVIRASTLSVKSTTFIEAAKALGASDKRVVLQHVLPQTLAPLLVLATAALSTAILVEASLSFLGLGVLAPTPSWGNMLSGQTLTNIQNAPWNAVFPGLALTITVLSFNLLGDSLRDTLDPRLRR